MIPKQNFIFENGGEHKSLWQVPWDGDDVTNHHHPFIYHSFPLRNLWQNYIFIIMMINYTYLSPLILLSHSHFATMPSIPLGNALFLYTPFGLASSTAVAHNSLLMFLPWNQWHPRLPASVAFPSSTGIHHHHHINFKSLTVSFSFIFMSPLLILTIN